MNGINMSPNLISDRLDRKKLLFGVQFGSMYQHASRLVDRYKVLVLKQNRQSVGFQNL